jgi:hypothetical protein
MSGMGDMKFTTAGDMMMDLPTRLESWAQNEELVASGVMTEHGQDCMEAARIMRIEDSLLEECENELNQFLRDMNNMRAALRDMAKYVWRGDWDKLEPETRALLGEKE